MAENKKVTTLLYDKILQKEKKKGVREIVENDRGKFVKNLGVFYKVITTRSYPQCRVEKYNSYY
jgi:hypothetical protein